MARSCLGIDVGIRNLSFCILQLEPSAILKWELIDVLELCGLPDLSCTKLTSSQMHDIARYALPRIFPVQLIQSNQISHVSIEQQPHGKYGNQKIILFSHLIYDYFRQYLFNQVYGDTMETVVFTGAAKKYDKLWFVKYGLPKPKNYADRKSTSTQLCHLLCDEMQLPRMPTGHCKEDDLADAFLLAVIGWETVKKQKIATQKIVAAQVSRLV
jgi:hypothetical protein